MSPEQFKSRFLASVPETPPELELGLGEFVRADPSEVEGVPLSAEDSRLLLEVGLPRDAPPFLSFRRYPDLPKEAFLRGTFELGTNAQGDPICFELTSRTVVIFNHDRDMERVFVNSSLLKLAECLCLYQEHFRAQDFTSCFETMCKVDPELANHGGFWKSEIEQELRSS